MICKRKCVHYNKYTIGSCDDTILSKYPKVKNVPQKIYIKHLKKQTLSVLSTSHTFNGLTLVTIQNLEPTQSRSGPRKCPDVSTFKQQCPQSKCKSNEIYWKHSDTSTKLKQ